MRRTYRACALGDDRGDEEGKAQGDEAAELHFVGWWIWFSGEDVLAACITSKPIEIVGFWTYLRESGESGVGCLRENEADAGYVSFKKSEQHTVYIFVIRTEFYPLLLGMTAKCSCGVRWGRTNVKHTANMNEPWKYLFMHRKISVVQNRPEALYCTEKPLEDLSLGEGLAFLVRRPENRFSK